MHLATTPFNGGICIAVEDPRIDATVAVEFKDQVKDMLAHHKGRVLLDLSKVSFIDSSGLGSLVAVMKALPQGTTLELAGLTPIVDKVIHLTRMDQVFQIHDKMPDLGMRQAAAI